MLQPLNKETAHVETHHPERVIQFGGGNFLRAFVDWMIEELNEKADFASSVVIVKPTPHGSYHEFDEQDNLFHVQLNGIQQGQLVTTRKLITCVSRNLNPYQDYAAFLALAEQPEMRFIVSNTTESGIVFDANDKQTDECPTSFPAKVAALLYRRYQTQPDKGLIILPCELIEDNGAVLQRTVLQYADLWQLGADFTAWVEAQNHFCNTLVDRIVTGFPAERRDESLRALGFDDKLLVEGEQYHSWIIEAPQSLANELPVHKTSLNVKIVDDAAPYRNIKVRILNGAHTSMVPLGYLLGLEAVREVIEHPQLGAFIQNLINEEVIPTIPMPEAELTQFAADVFDRFRNPFLHHRLLSIALNSISKFRARLLPTLLDYVQHHGQVPPRITLAFAALIRFYKGEWQGQPIPLNDDAKLIERLHELWQLPVEVMVPQLLAETTIWGQDLSQVPGLVGQIMADLRRIDAGGLVELIK